MKKLVIILLVSTFTFSIISCEINPPELSGIEGIVIDSLGNPAANIEINATVIDTKFLSGKLIAESKILTDTNGKFQYSREIKNAEIYLNLNIFPNPIYPYVYKLAESNKFGTYGVQKALNVRRGEYFKDVKIRYLSRTEIKAYEDSLLQKRIPTSVINAALKY